MLNLLGGSFSVVYLNRSLLFVICNCIRVVVERAADLQLSDKSSHQAKPTSTIWGTVIDLLVSYNVQMAIIERGVRVTA